MDRTIDISVDRLGLLISALQLGIILVPLIVLAGTSEKPITTLIVFLVGLCCIAPTAAFYRYRAVSDDGPDFGWPGDLMYDPLAPGRAAKERWQKAVDRLPDGDDKGE